jgi:hypothetical protein
VGAAEDKLLVAEVTGTIEGGDETGGETAGGELGPTTWTLSFASVVGTADAAAEEDVTWGFWEDATGGEGDEELETPDEADDSTAATMALIDVVIACVLAVVTAIELEETPEDEVTSITPATVTVEVAVAVEVTVVVITMPVVVVEFSAAESEIALTDADFAAGLDGVKTRVTFWAGVPALAPAETGSSLASREAASPLLSAIVPLLTVVEFPGVSTSVTLATFPLLGVVGSSVLAVALDTPSSSPLNHIGLITPDLEL